MYSNSSQDCIISFHIRALFFNNAPSNWEASIYIRFRMDNIFYYYDDLYSFQSFYHILHIVKVREGRWAADSPKLCVFLDKTAISHHI